MHTRCTYAHQLLGLTCGKSCTDRRLFLFYSYHKHNLILMLTLQCSFDCVLCLFTLFNIYYILRRQVACLLDMQQSFAQAMILKCI